MQKAQNRIKNLEANLRSALVKGTENTKLFLDLGRAHHLLYEGSHKAEDLESAIKHYKSGLEHVPLDEVHHAPLAFHLGNALMTRFREKSDMQDLQDAITFHEQALELRPAGHRDRDISLYKVAAARVARFRQPQGDIKDLHEAITFYKEALILHPVGQIARFSCLQGLAHALTNRSSVLKDEADLQEAIIFFKEALDLCPSGHPERSTALSSLARGLLARFRKLDEVADLQEAVSLYEQALRLRPAGHPSRAVSLRNLAGALGIRFRKLGEIKDLQAAIEFHERGLRLCPDGHPSHALASEGLADALMIRFGESGEMKDLNKAIELYKKVLKVHSTADLDRSPPLDDLADALFVRFRKQRDVVDLEEAIILFKKLLALHPSGHPGQHLLLGAVASALLARYKLLQIIEDIHEAITYLEQASKMCPVGHPAYLKSLVNLAHGFVTRFKSQRDIGDLEKGINLHEKVLDLSPSGHPDRSMALDGLTHALVMKFEKLRNIEDLQKAIVLEEEAVNLCPIDDSKRSDYLYGLAHALKLRAQHLKEIEDLKKATTLYKQVLEMCPDGHYGRPLALKNLATSFLLQFKYTGEMSDMKSAESGYKAALSCLPPGHPFCSTTMASQASLIMALHKSDSLPCQGCSHVDEACTLLKMASNHTTSTLQQRFNASASWADAAHTYEHQSALIAYTTALELQHQLLALLAPAGTSPRGKAYSSILGSEAVFCAIEAGNLEAAIQFMEQGRSMLWSTIRQYRHPFEELSTRDPDLAKQFRMIGHQIGHHTLADVDVSQLDTIYKQWTALLAKIRNLHSFSNFLQPTPYETLKNIAKEGPVIILDPNESHSDVIVLTASVAPVIITLHGATSYTLYHLVQLLSKATTGTRPSKDIVSILQYLWNAVVQPVVEQLALLQIPEKSHIWWCPTSYFSALPLHAAGPYKQGLKNLPDLYISSYIPTLGSLIEARETITKPQSGLNLLLVSQPENILTGMLEETRTVEKFREHINVNIDVYSGEDAHKAAVLAGLQSHSWVHFCCHSHLIDCSSGDNVFKPWLQLHDNEPLTVHDLAKAQLPNADFAFLSTCHSAEESVRQSPNLYTNLPAALQFCGFKSVVGTLWETVDDNGPIIADAFYKHMFRNAGTANVKDAAEALNVATREMRKQGVPLDQWINYIHVGV